MKQRIFRKKTLGKSSQLVKEVYDPFANFQGNQFELYIANFFYTIRKHWKLVLIMIIFFSIISVSFFFYHIYLDNLEKKALLEYEELEKSPVLKTQAADINLAIEKLDKYISSYPLDSAKKRAIIKKILLYEQKQEFEKAAEQYEELAKLVPYPELKINFLYRSAIHLENSQKYSRALSNIEEIQKLMINDNLINVYVLYTQTRLLHKLGKKEDAKRLAYRIIDIDDSENPEIKTIKLLVSTFFIYNQ